MPEEIPKLPVSSQEVQVEALSLLAYPFYLPFSGVKSSKFF